MFSHNKKLKAPVEKLDKKNPSFSADLALRMLIACISTTVAHPLRVLLNEASVKTNPFETIKAASSKIFRDVPINAIRGTTSTGLQSIVKYYVNQYYGFDSYMGRVAGLFGASAAGVFVTPIEIAFMRKNALRALQDSVDVNSAQLIKQTSLMKFNKPIFAFFAARELGFCVSVFGTENLPFYQKLPFFFVSALVTAVAHKLAAIEITKDIRQIGHLVPDYTIGIRAAFKNIAYGDTYLHDAFKVPKVNPKTATQLATNFFTATCGPNMFFFRLVYLAAFANIFSMVNSNVRQTYTNSFQFQGNDIDGDAGKRMVMGKKMRE